MQKPFSWSYSRLKNFETCAKRYFEIDVQKAFKGEEGENLVYGNLVHEMLEHFLAKGTPIPELHKPDLQKWGEYAQQLYARGMDVKVEQKLAITSSFGPCEYFSRHAWYRCKVDVLARTGPVGIALDWKTGRILDDSQQLALTAACMFAHYPELQKIRTEFIWIKEDCTTRSDFAREGMTAMWAGLWPRIENLKKAHDTGSFPPNPSGLCRRFCPVETCAYHGKGSK